MARAGDVIDDPVTGERFVFEATAQETNGELLRLRASGEPKGFFAREHLHRGSRSPRGHLGASGAGSGRGIRHRAGRHAQYVFLDEWEVDAPIDATFDALADARTYPQWWRPV